MVLLIHTAVAGRGLVTVDETTAVTGDRQSRRDMRPAKENAIVVVQVTELGNPVAEKLRDSRAVEMVLDSLVAEKQPGDMAVVMPFDSTSLTWLDHTLALVSVNPKAFFQARRSES